VTREAARREVRRVVDASWTRGSFADKAKLDPGTLGDFLDGRRWPQGGNRTKIERALGWPLGKIMDLAEAEESAPPPMAAAASPVGLGLDDAAEGLAVEQVERIRALILDIKGTS